MGCIYEAVKGWQVAEVGGWAVYLGGRHVAGGEEDEIGKDGVRTGAEGEVSEDRSDDEQEWQQEGCECLAEGFASGTGLAEEPDEDRQQGEDALGLGEEGGEAAKGSGCGDAADGDAGHKRFRGGQDGDGAVPVMGGVEGGVVVEDEDKQAG